MCNDGKDGDVVPPLSRKSHGRGRLSHLPNDLLPRHGAICYLKYLKAVVAALPKFAPPLANLKH